jgi:hypothetical protein
MRGISSANLMTVAGIVTLAADFASGAAFLQQPYDPNTFQADYN